MGSVTRGWPSLRSLFALAMSAVTSAEEVKVLVGFSGACGAGCFAIATMATRVKARLIIILRIKPPSVLHLASASYASPALDTTICPRNQGEPDTPRNKRCHPTGNWPATRVRIEIGGRKYPSLLFLALLAVEFECED